MEEIKRKEYRKFVTRQIIYCIIYVIVSFVLLFELNTFLSGMIVTSIFAIVTDVNARTSAQRTIKKLENLQN
jgi:hypothetical protein